MLEKKFLYINGMLGSQVTPLALGARELAGSNPAIPTKYGGLAERSIASVLKTEDVERHPGVRIPKPPQIRCVIPS